jgi:hypothetical protein
MHLRKLWLSYFIIFLLILPVLNISITSSGAPPPIWNNNWSYFQEINLPISTEDKHAIYQPIDLLIEFDNPCWAKNEKEHSIRIVCWDGLRWHELESQIYDLEFDGSTYIKSCVIIFLVPEFSNGVERYFVYYDNSEKLSVNYHDHVSIKDAFYYYEPITGISVEGDYYEIKEDGYIIYGVGQKGNIINRWLSQAILKMKPKSKEFSAVNSDKVAAYSFTYNTGPKDEDQASSDQKLVSKEIMIDGNLMVEFGIVSQSENKNLRTTNIYRYYYCPTDTKRIIVHVKHEVLEEGIVRGQINVDGTYGALFSYKSKSGNIPGMRFGQILPFLHISGEDKQIKEYKLNTNPENKEREWIIPYTDDCDLGQDAWFSYDEGESGKAFGFLFSSNEDIVKYGKDERDGIQLKATQKEYLRVLGAEVDYVGISFGRNSYEPGSDQDLNIAGDLVVEFDVEFFTSEEGGLNEVIAEYEYFQKLSEYRGNGGEPPSGENIYTLRVAPRLSLSGRFFSHPIFSNISGFTFSELSGEIFQNGELVSEGEFFKPLFGAPKIIFSKLSPGDYVVKIFHEFLNRRKKICAIFPIKINSDRFRSVLCTWERNIKIITKNQNNERIENIDLNLYKNNFLILRNITNNYEDTSMKVSLNFFSPYVIKAYYKGYKIYDNVVPRLSKNVNINLDLYDLIINVKDDLGFNPGVNVRPYLTSQQMDKQIEIIPEDLGGGRFLFKNLPASDYTLYISYGRFSNELDINIPDDIDSPSIKFTATFDLRNELLDSRGSTIDDKDLKISIIRDGILIKDLISPDEIIELPPGKYTVNVYSDGNLIGSEKVDFNNDKSIKIITKIEPILPILITGIVIILILEFLVLLFFKRISFNTFLKLLAMTLVILSLFQPWWVLNATNDNYQSEKNSEMLLYPQTMIETISYDDKEYFELATLPEMFTNFLGTLLLIIYTGIVLLIASFIPNVLLKRRFFIILITASIVFMVLVALAFSIGMSLITELTLGSLFGNGPIEVILPNGETINMQANWGLGAGFYLCVFSALILIAAGIFDYLQKRQWFSRLKNKISY